jgi:hypothetical protein
MTRIDDPYNRPKKATGTSGSVMRLLLAFSIAMMMAAPVAGHGLPDRGADSDQQAIAWVADSALDPAPATTAPGFVPFVGRDNDAHGISYAPTPTTMYAAPGQQIVFWCPEARTFGDLPPLPLGVSDDPVVYGCPIRVYDTTYSFGNTEIAINHADHNQVAFFTLHGTPGNRNAPSDNSRTGRTHTAFTSFDQGLTWEDQPTEPGQYGGGFGDWSSGAMDSYGNVYSAYTWHLPCGSECFTSSIGMFKGPTTSERGGVMASYGRGVYVDGRDEGNFITRAHIINLPSYVPPLNTTDNKTAEPSTEDENGEEALDWDNATEERMVMVWHERAYDWTNSSTRMSAWIDAAWSHTGTENEWTRLNDTQLIGPCRDASNPVHYKDKVYVACVVERGYNARQRALVGDVDIWSINVYNGKTTFESTTRVDGGRPLLASNDRGYMAMVSYKKIASNETMQRLDITAAFGWYGHNWETLGNFGADLRRDAGGPRVPILDADVTGLALTEDEGTAVIVYKEWIDDPQAPEGIDPEDPLAHINNRLTDYNKYIVTFNQCTYPIAGAKMELGQGVDSYNAQAYVNNPAIFNDKQDGLVATRDAEGNEMVYFAVNDYGSMQYGAMFASGVSQFCALYTAPPGLPAAAIPQAIGLSQANNFLVGSAVAVPAAMMVFYLLAMRKRAPSYVAAEDK